MDREFDGYRNSNSYPEVFPFSISHGEFPLSSVPRKKDLPKLADAAVRIARCPKCTAYINPFCEASSLKWTCSLCGNRNIFPKSMIRYRHVDLKYLPEMQNALIDYPMPLMEENVTEYSNPCFRDKKQLNCPAAEFPLVHVFLVQESMPLACLQAAVEALSVALRAVHPDVQIVLLSFSNRIGVYRLDANTTHVCVQYLHFTMPHGSEEGGTVASAADGGGAGRSVFDGRDTVLEEGDGAEVGPLLPLEAVVQFEEVALSAGDTRDNLDIALSCLLEASPSTATSKTFSAEDMKGQKSRKQTCTNPLVMTGPALEAVLKWLLTAPSPDNQDLATYAGEALGSNPFVTFSADATGEASSGLAGLFSGLGLLSPDSSKRKNAFAAPVPPISKCSGVTLHILLSNPQDLPPGSHPSVAASGVGGTRRFDANWTEDIAAECALHGLCVNAWGIADFDSSEIGLADLLPLCRATGGSVHRCILGEHPSAETLRLATQMTNSICFQSATKCLLKIRGSPILDMGLMKVHGNCSPHPNLPGIHRIANCSVNSSFACNVKYSESDPSSGRGVVVQYAFSFYTLVEDDDSDAGHFSETDSNASEYENESYFSYLHDSRGEGEGEGVVASPFSPATDYSPMSPNASPTAHLDGLRLRRVFVQYLRRRYMQYMCDAIGEASSLALHNKYCQHRAIHDKMEFRLARKEQNLATLPTYNPKRRLIVVKRLRVMTMMIELSSKVPRIIKLSQPGTIASLIVRKCLVDLGDFKSKSEYLKHCCQEIVMATAIVIEDQRTLASERSDRSDGGGQGREGSAFVSTTFAVEKYVRDALNIPQVRSLLQILYGAIHLFTVPLSTSTFYLNKCLSDIVAEAESFVSTYDVYHVERFLYPELLPMTSDMKLDPQFVGKSSLPLRRESLTLNPSPCYLLDSSTDIVIYRPAHSKMHSKSESSSGQLQVDTTPLQARPNMHMATKPVVPAPQAPLQEEIRVVTMSDNTLTSRLISAYDDKQDDDEVESNSGAEDKERCVIKLGAEEFPARVRDPAWVVHDLQRRLSISAVVPRILLAEGGMMSSSNFTLRLIDDMSCVTNHETGQLPAEIGFIKFVDMLGDDVIKLLGLQNK